MTNVKFTVYPEKSSAEIGFKELNISQQDYILDLLSLVKRDLGKCSCPDHPQNIKEVCISIINNHYYVWLHICCRRFIYSMYANEINYDEEGIVVSLTGFEEKLEGLYS